MDKILNNLGLCNRAGKLISGTDMVCDYLASGKVCYIFLLGNGNGELAVTRLTHAVNRHLTETCGTIPVPQTAAVGDCDLSAVSLLDVSGEHACAVTANDVIGLLNVGDVFHDKFPF